MSVKSEESSVLHEYIYNHCFELYRKREVIHAKPYGELPNEFMLEFIWDISEGLEKFESGVIYQTFRCYNSYYFATMLKDAFPGGELVWAYPNKHICYMFEGVPYDVCGVYNESKILLPYTELGDCIEQFMHRGHDKDLENEFYSWCKENDYDANVVKHMIYDMIPVNDRLPIGDPMWENKCKDWDVLRNFKKYKDKL